MKIGLKILVVLLLSYAASYAINYFLFHDSTAFTTSSIVVWIVIALFLIYLFVWGDLKRKA